MSRIRKDEILERLVFTDGLIEAYARPDRERTEPAGDHWTEPVLLERVAYLRKLAHFSQGVAWDTVREFAGYSILLMVLVRSGDALADKEHSHTFIVLDGRATLLTGRTLERPGTAAADELRVGDFVGLMTRELRRGDVEHIGAAIPHQFLLSGDKGLSCMVIRINESGNLPRARDL